MSQLNSKNEDKALVKKAEDPKTILAEAKGIALQRDANAFVVSLRHLAQARKSHITYVNLVGPYRTGLLVSGTGIALIMAVLAWTILRPDGVEGISLYGVLAALIGGVMLTLFGVRRVRAITQLDELLPPTIDEADVSEAARVVSTFGAYRHSFGSAITGIASIVDGAVAGWVISAALVSSTPVWIQGLASVGVALLMVMMAGGLGEHFRARMAIIRARLMARHALELREEHYKGAVSEAAYIAEWTKPITGNKLAKPNWKAYSAAAGTLFGIALLFALLATIRLMSPEDGLALSGGVVVTTAMLGAAFAVLGALVNAFGPLRPDEQRKATLLHDRFPSVAVFRVTKARHERGIAIWCNGLARRVRATYMELCKDMDPRARGVAVDVAEPFTFSDEEAGPGDEFRQGVPADAAGMPASEASPSSATSGDVAKPKATSPNFAGIQGGAYAVTRIGGVQ